MGNNMGGGSSKAAKVMKINGEFFKLKTPAKVIDVIKDYPNHVLLDSDEFLRFNLRANPLDPQDELKPKRIYLLVELPEFPGPLRRVQSGVNLTTVTPRVDLMMIKRSISDLSILTRSTVTASMDSDHDGGSAESPAGSTRVKMRLPKAEVQKIVKESGDNEVEIAERILRLCLEDPATRNGGGRGEERESVEEATVAERRFNNARATCIPNGNYRRRYGKLTP